MSLWRDLDSLTRNLLKIASQYIATGDSYHNSLIFCCEELNIPSWDGNICKTAAAAIVNKSHSVLFRISSGKWFGGRATLCLHKFLPKEELGRKFWSSSQFPKLWKWQWRYCQIRIETRDKLLDWSPQEELRQRFWSSSQLPQNYESGSESEDIAKKDGDKKQITTQDWSPREELQDQFWTLLQKRFAELPPKWK